MIEDEMHLVRADRAELEGQVAAHPFLVGLSAHHIRLLADCAMRSQFTAGQVIFQKGETANRFYLIERGRVALESSASDDVVQIDEVGAGDLLGWSWIFPPYVWHFDARAIESTTAIFFYGTILREYCDNDPALGYDLFKRMSEVMMRRLQAARAKLSDALKDTSRQE
ncbi:MAG TPA: cyclic nucleotide-binding domain-containing protein [Terriglobales bacterium]|jgi:CRP-like cAMP-binding protein